jgi:glycosyltransferase involved in cell wall biosynthesis
MRIVMFSINPVFPRRVTGGASKHLYQIARYLGFQGHNVEIICAKPEEPLEPFRWVDRVRVSPILPFHLPFPQPYAISGGALALIVQRVANALKDADRFYIHDGEFLLQDVYKEIPTIISLRDNIYPESVLGSFIGKYDALICVSPYSAEVVRASVGQFYPELEQRLHAVNNGIDFEIFKPVDPMPLARELGLDPTNQTILLHPHRPEPGKGLPESIAVVDRLVKEEGISNLVVLVPEWIDSMVSNDESSFYRQMVKLMNDLDIRDHFKFMPWFPAARMPELYSLGRATLCLGNIVEAFGNVAYESLACGTPSVVARVGVHRTLLPDDLIDKVDYGDVTGTVDRLKNILESQHQVSTETLDYLHQNLDYQRQMEGVSNIITTARKKNPMSFEPLDTSLDRKYRLAPWCYFKGDRIFHDFKGEFVSAQALRDLLYDREWITERQAYATGFTNVVWQRWIEKTYIVPEWEKGR